MRAGRGWRGAAPPPGPCGAGRWRSGRGGRGGSRRPPFLVGSPVRERGFGLALQLNLPLTQAAAQLVQRVEDGAGGGRVHDWGIRETVVYHLSTSLAKPGGRVFRTRPFSLGQAGRAACACSSRASGAVGVRGVGAGRPSALRTSASVRARAWGSRRVVICGVGAARWVMPTPSARLPGDPYLRAQKGLPS
ncbi:hypothetical protein D9600_14910 [Deinococcus sp. DB0503]|nr:hypothetical protein [Deinococcus sp. DB0503]